MPKVLCNTTSCIHWIPGSTCTTKQILINGCNSQDEHPCTCNNFCARTPEYQLAHSIQNKSFIATVLRILAEGPYQPQVICTVETCAHMEADHCCSTAIINING